MISKSPEDQQFYEARLKFLRDQEALRLDQEANLEAARRQGREEGREQGRQEGRQEGIERGMERGRESGLLIGKILLLQELLGADPKPSTDFESLRIDELTSLVAELQSQLRERDNN